MNQPRNPNERLSQTQFPSTVETKRLDKIQIINDQITKAEQLIVDADGINESTSDTKAVEIRTNLQNALVNLGIKFGKLNRNDPDESTLLTTIIDKTRKINELKNIIDRRLRVETLVKNNFFNGESLVDNLDVLIDTKTDLDLNDFEYLENLLLEELSKYVDEQGEIISQTEYDENNGEQIVELLDIVESKMDEIRSQIAKKWNLDKKTLKDANLEELLTTMESKINNSKETLTKAELSSTRENLITALDSYNYTAKTNNLSPEHQDHINRINQLIAVIDSLMN